MSRHASVQTAKHRRGDAMLSSLEVDEAHVGCIPTCWQNDSILQQLVSNDGQLRKPAKMHVRTLRSCTFRISCCYGQSELFGDRNALAKNCSQQPWKKHSSVLLVHNVRIAKSFFQELSLCLYSPIEVLPAHIQQQQAAFFRAKPKHET